MIKVNNLNFSYKKNEKIINDISFEIKKGDFVSIIGHNGSGKSTLTKLLVGLLNHEDGDIYIEDVKMTSDNILELRRKIGIVFQNPDNQFVGSTVEEDIAFGLENIQMPREEIIKRVDKYSRKVKMENFLESQPHNLSGGQKQRVAIAGIVAMNSDIIIFDEATSMLDPKGKEEVVEMIKELNAEGKTIIMVTHDLEEAKMSDRIIVMDKGFIKLEGTPKEVFTEIELLKSISLDVPMALNVLNETNIKNEELRSLLWELSLKM